MSLGGQLSIALLLSALAVVAMADSNSVRSKCAAYGAHGGCSSCQLGSQDLCQWCVDPRDTSGLNYMNGIRPPRCLPKYSCSALSNGQLQPMRGTLCPPLGETEPPFRGQMTTKSATTIWSTAHSLNYCNFSIQPYVIDRSTSPCRCCIPDGSPIISIAALGGQESCGQVNNNLNAGVGIAVNQMAERCFGSQRGHLTSKMQQCVRLIQSFACTSHCPQYGVATSGYTKSSCDRLMQACSPWVDTASQNCILASLKQSFGSICHADDSGLLLEDTDRIPATGRWEFEYGLKANYSLPVHCVWGDWTSWGACSKSCGGGVKTRTRPFAQPPLYNGNPCTGAKSENTPCNSQGCNIDCAFEWNSWTACDKQCGGGTQSRVITITQPKVGTGEACPASPQSQACNTFVCPIDCTYTWNDWSTCTESCGGGTQSRTITITQPKVGTGADCPSPVSQDCNTDFCPEDCVYSWNDWSTCTKPCDGGTQFRTITITKDEVGTGKPCPTSPQTQDCNTEVCNQDCVSSWSDWSGCTVLCGGGTSSRTLTITQQALGSGVPCPPSPETDICNIQECSVDCEYTWNDWSICSKVCGPGTQSRDITVTREQAGAGNHCPDTPETKPCNNGDCPNFVGSKILDTTMVSVLSSWQPGTWVLCYQLSTDGLLAAAQHDQCDSQGPTITLVKSTQGFVFGGYASQPFLSGGVAIEDPNAYLFTLSNPSSIPPTRFPIMQNSLALTDEFDKYYSWGTVEFAPVNQEVNSVPYGMVSGSSSVYDFSSVDTTTSTCTSPALTDIFLGTPDGPEDCLISMIEIETFYYTV